MGGAKLEAYQELVDHERHRKRSENQVQEREAPQVAPREIVVGLARAALHHFLRLVIPTRTNDQKKDRGGGGRALLIHRDNIVLYRY